MNDGGSSWSKSVSLQKDEISTNILLLAVNDLICFSLPALLLFPETTRKWYKLLYRLLAFLHRLA